MKILNIFSRVLHRRKMVRVFEQVEVKGSNNKKHLVDAKVDTGAYRTSLDRGLAKKLGLLKEENVVFTRHYRSSLGINQIREVIRVKFWMRGIEVNSLASVVDRTHMNLPMLIGRKDLKQFVVMYDPVNEIEGQQAKGRDVWKSEKTHEEGKSE